MASLENAYASYGDLEANSMPARPLAFPDPNILRARRISNALIYDREVDQLFEVQNIVFRDVEDVGLIERGFWIQQKIKKAIYGCIRACRVVKPCTDPLVVQDQPPLVIWELTDEFVAVKILDLDIIRVLGARHRENPYQEIAAMQMIEQYNRILDTEPIRVLNAIDVLSDDNYLYLFMPYCNRGELFSHLEENGRFPEPLARYYFKQLLDGLFCLQKTGVCHRDISLENILVNEENNEMNILFIDLGMCLRVPFTPLNGGNGSSDVGSGTLRKLIIPQGQCGKQNYISPEILENNEAFDGYGIDTWAIGVVLFILVVGLPPWDWASPDDARFRMVAQDGRLEQMLRQWNRPISPLALDLLQGIFRSNARNRLTFGQIKDHAWVHVADVIRPH